MSNPLGKLLSIDKNAKTIKGQKVGYMTGILYLAPSDESGVINVCPSASAGCRAACLFRAGRGVMKPVYEGRMRKTLAFKNNRALFIETLKDNIRALIRKAARENMIPCVRLNGTSDLPWENMGIMQEFPNVQFYDYVKVFSRMHRYLKGEMPSNYHLTFSRSESNEIHAQLVASMGGNVAVVFSDKNLPDTYYNHPVISGDGNDLRFLDPSGVIVGLYAKGKAKKDNSGFVVPTAR